MRCLYCHNPDTWAPQKGQSMTIDEILEIYEKNKGFYQNGGITITGGEPLMQLAFVTELFQAAKAKNIHTCLDTSGILYREKQFAAYEKLFSCTNLILLDIKHSVSEEHKKLTGHPLSPVLDFLKASETAKVPVIIRHVIVKGLTDFNEELNGIGKILASHKNIKGLEVLPYHNMGEQKYLELNMEYPLKGMENLSKEECQKARSYILESYKKYRGK